jgi:hypothetical protein
MTRPALRCNDSVDVKPGSEASAQAIVELGCSLRRAACRRFAGVVRSYRAIVRVLDIRFDAEHPARVEIVVTDLDFIREGGECRGRGDWHRHGWRSEAQFFACHYTGGPTADCQMN